MRYKEYNVNRVLEKCIHLFWKNGFKSCSVNDIVELTGVNRFSLYHEFDDKNGILYNSLKLYKERYCTDKFDILKESGTPEEILSKFYLSFLNPENVNQGCFIIHIGTELADTDENIRQLVKSFLNEIQVLMEDLLERNNFSRVNTEAHSRQLIGLFCTAMSFCLIQSEEERERHIAYGLRVIFNKNKAYATGIK